MLARHPVEDVFVASRVEACGLDGWRLGAEVWGYGERGALTSLCYAGANLVPVQADGDAVRAFAERARRQGRRCSSLVGSAAAAMGMWQLLEPAWGPAREVRPVQPLMAIDDDPLVAPDAKVRRVLPHELDVLLPACVAMFTEEVGVSPLIGDGGSLYRARVEELVALGRAFARIEGGAVLFKAEIGASTREVCQVQGVWVHPSLRGRGVGASGTAAVVEQARRTIAPVVSLYVNDYNLAARGAYERVGFRQVGTFASVLF
ncbi:MAG: GNAT family N-acetyltransferase [Actinomycetota bacterium]|nr:GNAT family N-acetyltransferase [Actinomycetota bacterium]